MLFHFAFLTQHWQIHHKSYNSVHGNRGKTQCSSISLGINSNIASNLNHFLTCDRIDYEKNADPQAKRNRDQVIECKWLNWVFCVSSTKIMFLKTQLARVWQIFQIGKSYTFSLHITKQHTDSIWLGCLWYIVKRVVSICQLASIQPKWPAIALCDAGMRAEKQRRRKQKTSSSVRISLQNPLNSCAAIKKRHNE